MRGSPANPPGIAGRRSVVVAAVGQSRPCGVTAARAACHESPSSPSLRISDRGPFMCPITLATLVFGRVVVSGTGAGIGTGAGTIYLAK